MTGVNKTLIASAVGLTLMGAAATANALLVPDVLGVGVGTFTTDRANFTMLNGAGGATGGTNDVVMAWDGNAYTSSSDYTGPGGPSNVTASSDQLFQSHLWTAHDIQVFVPGSYTFDTSLGGGNGESGILTLNVGLTQLGMHMLFDWNGNNNIDVVVVTAQLQAFGSGTGTFGNATLCSAPGSNCLWNSGPASSFAGNTTANRPAGNHVWMLTSVDGNGDGIPGIGMAAGGPFAGFNGNFSADMTFTPALTAVPVPAAVWLFGSGLFGLAGISRRKKKA